MDRRKARETAMELLFEREFNKDLMAEDELRLAEDSREFESDSYVEGIYFGVSEHLEEIDALITARSIGWKTKRMTKVSLSILRLAVYEMQSETDNPVSVVINEAVELAKKYGGAEDASFINGVLGTLARA